ncbi:recombination protein NinG [Pseudomonas sp. NA13]
MRDYRCNYELSIGSGCISCGQSQEEIRAAQDWTVGGAFDAGHFMGKGARPELRLTPSNIWLQCQACNSGSYMHARKGYTVSQGFRTGLIARIGLEAVEALEADHEPRKYTVEELKAITAEYRAKTRELKKGGCMTHVAQITGRASRPSKGWLKPMCPIAGKAHYFNQEKAYAAITAYGRSYFWRSQE